MSPAAVEALCEHLARRLTQRSEGISEYELLRRLAADGVIEYGETQSRDTLALFQVHFLLFHALYVLRDRLRAQQRGDLEINAVSIRLLPYAPRDSNTLDLPDPLREYYLNWSNCRDTDAADIDRMLGRFWIKYVRNDARREALDALGLCDPVDDDTIKQAWRRLAMQHHPDRGGDGEKLQRINAAVEQLLR